MPPTQRSARLDGLQVVAAGNLRGAGDTHTPMITGLIAYWAVGLPIGYLLAFFAGLRVVGLWVGLSLGLITAGVILLSAWSSRARGFMAGRRLDPVAVPTARSWIAPPDALFEPDGSGAG